MIVHAAKLFVRVAVLCFLAAQLSFGPSAWAQTAASTPGASSSPPATTPGAAAVQSGTPAAAGTAAPAGSPAPDATKGAEADACKKAAQAVATGHVAALNSLPKDKRTALESRGDVIKVLTCLAVVEGNTKHCDALPKAAKDDCVAKTQLILKAKALPKGASFMPLVMPGYYEECKTHYAKAVCDQLQDAVLTRNQAKCKGLPEPLSAGCNAFVSGNPDLCPEGDFECRRVTVNEPKFRKGGLKALDDPFAKAAASGKRDACGPLVADLENHCTQ